MRILSIDTATEACSVALWNKGSCFSSFEESSKEHTKLILPMVEDILHLGDITLKELNALAFCRGPGSFTGIRIGISLVQGLALGAKLPIIGISTLLTMAQGAFRRTGSTKVLSAINARTGEVYWAEYIRDKHGIWHGEETEVIYRINDIKARLNTISGKWAIVGTGWKTWPEILQDIDSEKLTLVSGNTLLPTAQDILPIAIQILTKEKAFTLKHTEPVYLCNEII